MRRLLHVLALLLLAAEPAYAAAWQQGQKVASGSTAVLENLALENVPLNTECIQGYVFAASSPYNGAAFRLEVTCSISTTVPETSQNSQDVDSHYSLNNCAIPSFKTTKPFFNFFGRSVAAKGAAEIVASNGTRITGLTRHGVNRVIGDGASRAGVRPQALLDALKNPKKIVEGIDSQGRPFQVFHGADARVVVNPKTGEIVSANPLSGAGALRTPLP